MLDDLLGRGFATKCKSLIKITKTRIDVIRRKRRATEKFLKKDIADLLLNGLDINAYGRADGLMVELTLSSCYDFVEQLCQFVLKHLSVMQKLSGCPEECREAVSSLMFAAARFSDLPELRGLRQIFQERYGNSLECYVNQKFVANLNFKSSTLEKKVCLMQEIASEFSIKWDSKAFELRMSKSFAQGHNTCMSNYLTDYDKPSHGKDATPKYLTDYDKPSHGKDATPKGVKHDVLFDRSPDHPNDGYRFQNRKEAVALNRDDHDLQSRSTLPGKGFKPLNGCEVISKSDGHDNPLTGRQEVSSKNSDRENWKEGSMLKPIGRSSQEKIVKQFEGGSTLHDSWGNTSRLRESQDTAARKSPSHAGMRFKSNVNEPFAANHVGLPDTDNSERKLQKDETPMLKPCYSYAIPPPYVKPKFKQQNSTHGANVLSSHIDSDGISTYFSAHDKSDAASTSGRIQIGLDNSDQDWQPSRHESLSKHCHEREFSIHEDAKEIPVLKLKSTRRKHSKSRSSHSGAANEDVGVVRKSRSRSRKRDESRRGLQNLFDDERYGNAEEEKIIDKLLIHYSKKPSVLVPEKARRKSRSHHAHVMDNSARESIQNGNRDGSDETPETVAIPPRSVSLPREQTGAVEVKKVFTRAASFQPNGSKEARHVHPKLPDYDDLAARFAALRGR